jgi:nitroreductase/FMN reductase [NAD(P)H]
MTSAPDTAAAIAAAIAQRFAARIEVDPAMSGLDTLATITARRTHRRYQDLAVPAELVRLICAAALSAPSKSDLQQCDILLVRDAAKRTAFADLMPDMACVREAPVFLVFLANGRRIPRLAALRGKPFPNDHLDLFFNAVADAAIVLATFVTAAEAAGLGCCPISVIRDHAAKVATLLELPERVIPLAGMCVGWPADTGRLSPRLPLDVTLHQDRFDDSDLAQQIDAYDRRRAALCPYAGQRDPQTWGEAALYGWSEDKARQYSVPLRADFGAFVRAQGFKLD